MIRDDQPDAREGQAGRTGVAERPVVPKKLGNAGGGRRGKGEEALHWRRNLMGKLKLTVNEEKTRICKVPEGEFDFLGFTQRSRVI